MPSAILPVSERSYTSKKYTSTENVLRCDHLHLTHNLANVPLIANSTCALHVLVLSHIQYHFYCNCLCNHQYRYFIFVFALSLHNYVQPSQSSRYSSEVLQLEMEFHQISSTRRHPLCLCIWLRPKVGCW